MENITVANLISWIHSQPDNRWIHGHHSWLSCAVGDYAMEVHGEIPDDLRDCGKYSVVINSLYKDEGLVYYSPETNIFCDTLADRKSVMELLSNNTEWDITECTTYGKLKMFIEDYLLNWDNLYNSIFL